MTVSYIDLTQPNPMGTVSTPDRLWKYYLFYYFEKPFSTKKQMSIKNQNHNIYIDKLFF